MIGGPGDNRHVAYRMRPSLAGLLAESGFSLLPALIVYIDII